MSDPAPKEKPTIITVFLVRDQWYGRGVGPVWGLFRSGSGSLARVPPLFFAVIPSFRAVSSVSI